MSLPCNKKDGSKMSDSSFSAPSHLRIEHLSGHGDIFRSTGNGEMLTSGTIAQVTRVVSMETFHVTKSKLSGVERIFAKRLLQKMTGFDEYPSTAPSSSSS